MSSNQHPARRFGAKLAIFAATLCVSAAAFAHVFPKKQEPEANTTVPAPAQVQITFTGPLEPSFSTLTVTDAGGKQVNVDKATIDAQQPSVIAVALPALSAGQYTVHWAAVASDGHRTHGDYAFNVK